MSRFDFALARWAMAFALCVATPAVFAQTARPASKAFAGIGRAANPAEVKAWDIDVRPDFKGLPKGQGSVSQGEAIWDVKCASCHGSFGESAEVFLPVAGGVTAQDIKAGRVDGLMPGSNQPQRTTLMKLSTLSTLWDYINRAMPWNAPKSLSADDVYALTAFVLNLNNVVPAGFTLSDKNIRDVQAILPNRNGMTMVHAMWPGKELGGAARPDAPGSACMRNCQPEIVIKSFLPDYARNAHGNLAEQSRGIGPVRGVDTTRAAPDIFTAGSTEKNPALRPTPVAQSATEKVAPSAGETVSASAVAVMPLLQKNACLACHGMDTRLVGPSFKDVAGKYGERADAVDVLSGKIRSGGQGVWGNIAMPAQSLSLDEATLIARWLVQGANK